MSSRCLFDGTIISDYTALLLALTSQDSLGPPILLDPQVSDLSLLCMAAETHGAAADGGPGANQRQHRSCQREQQQTRHAKDCR